ncbi:origin recognition complex, subunit 5-like [Ceratobasidium sp. AG-Ba]|nr:origin recognition complex, subunit 5-like [Ceratobasidium sp. AG-Ba]
MGAPGIHMQEIMSYYPGRTNILNHLSLLMAVAPPPFMHIFDPHTPRITCQLIASVLDAIATSDNSDIKPLRYASVDAREILAARQFYDRAINAFAGHRPTRASGYENWAGGTWSDCFDSFAAGLREIGKIHSLAGGKVKAEGETMEIAETSDQAENDDNCNLILVVENVNYLNGTLKELLVPLTRLSEMVPHAAVVFISDVRWDDVKETARACPDPYLITVPTLSREDTLLYLNSRFPTPIITKPAVAPPEGLPPLTAAHDDLVPLRRHFLSAVYDICSPHSRDPGEVAYVASATWPAFVAPVLADWETIRTSQVPKNTEDMDVDQDAVLDVDDTQNEQGPAEMLSAWRRADAAEYPLPTEATRLRLIRHFSPTILAAFHELHPRRTSARAWAKTHVPLPTFRASVWASYPQNSAEKEEKAQLKLGLGSHTQMLILASYIASYNPSKSDLRIFGRDASGIPKRKNRGYAKGKGKAATAKVPQKLIGPAAFNLERMLAILEALTLEYVDFPGLDDAHQREDMANLETNRAHILSEFAQLVQERRIVRAGSTDIIGSNSTYKCNVEFEEVDQMAAALRVPLHELLWDPENQ